MRMGTVCGMVKNGNQARGQQMRAQEHGVAPKRPWTINGTIRAALCLPRRSTPLVQKRGVAIKDMMRGASTCDAAIGHAECGQCGWTHLHACDSGSKHTGCGQLDSMCLSLSINMRGGVGVLSFHGDIAACVFKLRTHSPFQVTHLTTPILLSHSNGNGQRTT